MTMELLRCDSGRKKKKTYLNLGHAELIKSKCSELHGHKEENLNGSNQSHNSFL